MLFLRVEAVVRLRQMRCAAAECTFSGQRLRAKMGGGITRARQCEQNI
jgi:hypothetical protein